MSTPITPAQAPTTHVPRIVVAGKAGAPIFATPATPSRDAFVPSAKAPVQPAAAPHRLVTDQQAVRAMGLAGASVAGLIGAQYLPPLLAMVGLTGPVGLVVATVFACACALGAFKGAFTLNTWWAERQPAR